MAESMPESFCTIAVQYKTGGFPPRGLFCLWDDQITFVHSKWIQFVTPVPLIGAWLPIRVVPAGPEDPRTHTRILYADLAHAISQQKGRMVLVRTRSGDSYHFGGGSMNWEFRFAQVSAEIAKALEAAGYTFSLASDGLSVQDGARSTLVTSSALTVSREPTRSRVADIGGGAKNEATASQQATSRKQRAPSALRATAFGASGALLGAAAYAAFVILTGHDYSLVSVALGLIVAVSVGLAGLGLRPLWTRSISLSLTLVSLLLAEYVIARQDGGLTNASVVLSPSETVTLIRTDLALDAGSLWFWGIALLVAWSAPAYSGPRIVTRSIHDAAPSIQDATLTQDDTLPIQDTATRPDRRPWSWIIGKGRWLAATTACAIGLVALVILARVPLGTPGSDVISDPRVGDCFDAPSNDPSAAVPRLPCLRPHDDEIFSLFTMSPGGYPGDAAIEASGDKTCTDRLRGYLAGSPNAPLYDAFSVTSDRTGWESGDRSVVCVLFRIDEKKITGTARTPR